MNYEKIYPEFRVNLIKRIKLGRWPFRMQMTEEFCLLVLYGFITPNDYSYIPGKPYSPWNYIPT